jgi:hypothetical protein
MRLHGVILPRSLAESAPTIIPAGAFAATVKLVVVIVMNLSGLERSPPLENQPRVRWSGDRRLSIAIIGPLYTRYNKLLSEQQMEL